MKFIVFSDIHSNLEALTQFFEVTGSMKFLNHIRICLGDLIGYAGSPVECLELVRGECSYLIAGNHERMAVYPELREKANPLAVKAIEWTETKLKEEERVWLKSLPQTQLVNNQFLIVHGSPNDPDEYIFRQRQVLDSIDTMKNMKIKICFYGHTHIPGIWDESGRLSYSDNMPFNLSPNQYYLINPGSIGQPRDGDKRGSFCEWDDETNTVVFHRFDYDIDTAARKIKENRLPYELGERLYHGR
jgi:diadenosine tetraphosphatase ApaH/serine/threonine PP2A family protein phosphatase